MLRILIFRLPLRIVYYPILYYRSLILAYIILCYFTPALPGCDGRGLLGSHCQAKGPDWRHTTRSSPDGGIYRVAIICHGASANAHSICIHSNSSRPAILMVATGRNSQEALITATKSR